MSFCLSSVNTDGFRDLSFHHLARTAPADWQASDSASSLSSLLSFPSVAVPVPSRGLLEAGPGKSEDSVRLVSVVDPLWVWSSLGGHSVRYWTSSILQPKMSQSDCLHLKKKSGGKGTSRMKRGRVHYNDERRKTRPPAFSTVSWLTGLHSLFEIQKKYSEEMSAGKLFSSRHYASYSSA